MYNDEGSTGIVWENNLVHHTQSAGYHQHYGRGNIIRNNIIAYGAEEHVRYSRPEDFLAFAFERNIVLLGEGRLFMQADKNWDNGRVFLADNVYWRPDGTILEFAGKTWTDWQFMGRDTNSVVADPLFVAPDKGDWTLRPESPALKLGFVPFDWKQAGVTGDATWRQLAAQEFPPMKYGTKPKPLPLQLVEGFEGIPVGAKPSRMKASGKEPGIISVVADRPSKGQRCLQLTDGPDVEPAFEPHFYYNPNHERGLTRAAFDVRMEPDYQLVHEWRDDFQPYRTGPMLTFEKGVVRAMAKLWRSAGSTRSRSATSPRSSAALMDSDAPPVARAVIAVITGERGQREIVRPLAAVGVRCPVLDWEVLRARNRRPYLRFVRAVSHLVKARPGATVFTDMSSAFLAVILLVAKLRGSRVVLRLRGDPFAETRDQLRFHWRQREWPQLARALVSWLLDRPLFDTVDHFVPVSEWIVRRLGIAARSTVVRIPVPIGNFPPRSHEPTTPLRLLAVTNFNYPQKVAAMGRFLDDYGAFLKAHGIACTIAGAGIAWPSFRERHAGDAQFPGFVGDIASLYQQHDVFVHFSDLDAFPYVVLEAQAAGLPVLVNRACGMLEQIAHGETGLIVDLNDQPQVEKAILDLQRSPELRAKLGAGGIAVVAAKYSYRQIGEELQRALATR
jgi:glycosyltransferase involved in cell wall biosynthesis